MTLFRGVEDSVPPSSSHTPEALRSAHTGTSQQRIADVERPGSKACGGMEVTLQVWMNARAPADERGRLSLTPTYTYLGAKSRLLLCLEFCLKMIPWHKR